MKYKLFLQMLYINVINMGQKIVSYLQFLSLKFQLNGKQTYKYEFKSITVKFRTEFKIRKLLPLLAFK